MKLSKSVIFNLIIITITSLYPGWWSHPHCDSMMCLFLLADLKAGLQQHSAPESSHSSGSVTLAAFHGHIDFSPTLQIIAGCCESYPPPAGREEPLQRVDMRVAIWFEESDILASHWLRLTSVLPVHAMSAYLTDCQGSCPPACWGSILLTVNWPH